MLGGLPLVVRLGGYMVESNMGHIGDDIDPKGGDDPTLYGWRAAAEVARFSKHVAAQVYGAAPHHSYVWGGSGGGRRSPLCLENAPDAFDGALPFMGGGNIMPFPATEKVKSGQPIALRVHVQRAATAASRRQARPTRRRHAAGRQREPVRRAEQPRTRRARVPLRAGIPVRRRAHDLLADGSDLALDLDRRPARRAGPDVLHQLLDRARIHRSRPALRGGGRPHRRRHHGEQGDHRARPHDRSGLRGAGVHDGAHDGHDHGLHHTRQDLRHRDRGPSRRLSPRRRSPAGERRCEGPPAVHDGDRRRRVHVRRPGRRQHPALRRREGRRRGPRRATGSSSRSATSTVTT